MPRRPAAGPATALVAGLRGLQRRRWAWPVGVAALAVGGWLLWLPYLGFPLDDDMTSYATAAYWWARGDTLYRGITVPLPQGIIVVFRLIEAAGLGSIRGIHAVAAAYAALCALTVLAIAGRVWGRGIGLGAATLFTLILATPYLQGYTANAELFMLFPFLGSLALLLRADDHPLDSPPGLWLLAGSGLLAALALLIKPSGVAVLALAALWLLRRRRVEGASWRAWLRAEVVVGLGFALGLVPALAHGLLTAPDVYLNAVALYRLTRDSAASVPTDRQFGRFLERSAFVVAHLPVLLLAPVGLWAARRGAVVVDPLPGTRGAGARGRDLLWLWLLASFAGASMGGNWFFHYYQQVLPALAVAVALGVRALWQRPHRAPKIAGQGLAVIAIALLIVSVASLFPPGDPAQFSTSDGGPLAPYFGSATLATVYGWHRDDSAIAAYLRAHAAPDETVYVAYQRASIYYLSERRPATRWLDLPQLVWTPGAWDQQVARLGNPTTAPRYIVELHPFNYADRDADGALRATVARDYTLETTIGGTHVYRRKD